MISRWFYGFQRLGKVGWLYAARRRRRRLIALMEESGLFERAWYLEANRDVRDSGLDPARHYLESGWREGRDPGPRFCTTAYLKANSDVVALGVNPLVHYLEHGQAEGREAPHPRAPLRPAIDPIALFGPAAPCAQFEPPAEAAAAWTRGSRIRPDSGTVTIAGGISVARPSGPQRHVLDQALVRLAWLSGRSDTSVDAPTRAGTFLGLRDIWQAGQGILRTRWNARGKEPIVVRALQHVDDEPRVVGENCVTADLDLLDLRPLNPFFPLLFLFTDADGGLLGLSHLTFPTLCRGSVHYPELVALSRQQIAMDIASVEERLAGGLIAVRSGTMVPLVGEVVIDLEAADGARPLFQADFQSWLSRVMAVPMRPATDTDADFLAGAVRVEAANKRADGAASLVISSEMIPSISALCAGGTLGESRDEIAGPVIVTGDQLASIGTYVHVPPNSVQVQSGQAPNIARLSPLRTTDEEGADVPLLAIRLPRKLEIQEAELLAPKPEPRPVDAVPARTTTWLIWPASWNEASLSQSLIAVAQQVATTSSVVFVGEPSASIVALARRLFDDRVQSEPGAAAATKHIFGELCGYLGPDILLHDQTTVRRLAPLLDRGDVLTATATVVFAERRGRGQFVAAADGVHVQDARLLSGAVVPIAGASSDFWLSRADSVKRLLGSETGSAEGARHLCLTLLSVSRLDAENHSEPPISFPAARADQAISTEMLVG